MRKLILFVLTWSIAGPVFSANDCDRQCLRQVFNSYVDALVQHNPSAAPLGSEVQTIENLEAIAPGEGLWKSVIAVPKDFRIVVSDPVSQSVGAIVMMQEAQGPVEVALRLKLSAGLVVRADHLVARNLPEDNLKNLQYPRMILLSTVPNNKRMSRDDMLKVAADYYEAVEKADGSLAPFADDCVRHESGWQSTKAALPESPPLPEPGQPLHRDQAFLTLASYGCAEQLNTKIFANISAITERRVDIADPVLGLVFGFSHFQHEFKQKIFKLEGVPGIESVDWDLDPFDLYAAHIFKITDGEIREVEANGVAAPYNSPAVW